MSDAVIVGLIAAIPGILAAVSSFINGFRVHEVKALVNGLGEARNVATAKQAFAEGKTAEAERKEALAAIAAGKTSANQGGDSQPQP